MDVAAKIEALLLARGEPMERSYVRSFLKESAESVDAALTELRGRYAGTGFALVDNGEEVALRSAADASELIEKLRKDELERELSKASLETISIILYAGPLPRSTIDFIRGVNSQFILRSLLVRGLIERIEDARDSRRMLYRPSIELLSHLGVSRIEELPGYADFRAKLDTVAEKAIQDSESAIQDKGGDGSIRTS